MSSCVFIVYPRREIVDDITTAHPDTSE